MRPTSTTLLALLAVLAFVFDSLHTVEQQASTSTCFLVNATAYASVVQTKISNLYVRKDNNTQLTINVGKNGGISGAPVVENQIVTLQNIGGEYPHGYNPGNGNPAITCINDKPGIRSDACDCVLITAFGFDNLTTPTHMVAYAIDYCFLQQGAWTKPVPVTAAKCP